MEEPTKKDITDWYFYYSKISTGSRLSDDEMKTLEEVNRKVYFACNEVDDTIYHYKRNK